VVYRLIDPEQYKGQHVLVVGGGDSALEAAASIAETGGDGGGVVLSYRGAEFDRAKARNRDRIQAAAKTGTLQVMMKSNVKTIEAESVVIEHEGQMREVRNDAVIVSAGGVLPSDFLKRIGISVETKYGTA
jgi:thioredoxin reductase (NADPH)